MRDSYFRVWLWFLGMFALMVGCAHAPPAGMDRYLVRYKTPYLVVGEDFVQVGLDELHTFSLSKEELESRTLASAGRISKMLRQGMIDGVGSGERSDFDMRMEIRVSPKASWWLLKSAIR